MTDPNLTAITVILDRSGSMQPIDKDTCGGLNAFIEQQRKAEGRATMTLVRFNGTYELDYLDKPIGEVKPLVSLYPIGGTALHDAIGKTIDELGGRLSRLPEHERPGKVVVVIVTDGEENASKCFTSEQIKTKIEHQRHVYNWQFVFLGANQDAIANAKSIGISAALSANYSMGNTRKAFEHTSSNIGSFRSLRGGDAQLCAYSAQQRSALVGDAPLGHGFTIPGDPVPGFAHGVFADPDVVAGKAKTVGDLIKGLTQQGDLKGAGDLQAMVDAGRLKLDDPGSGRAFSIPGVPIGNVDAVAKVQLQP
jgi:hypothetical protein